MIFRSTEPVCAAENWSVESHAINANHSPVGSQASSLGGDKTGTEGVEEDNRLPIRSGS